MADANDNRTKLGRVVEAVRKRRLMEAAAPDLYEALDRLLKSVRTFSDHLETEAEEVAAAALAKARGEQVSA